MSFTHRGDESLAHVFMTDRMSSDRGDVGATCTIFLPPACSLLTFCIVHPSRKFMHVLFPPGVTDDDEEVLPASQLRPVFATEVDALPQHLELLVGLERR